MRWMTIAAVLLTAWALPAAADEDEAKTRLFFGAELIGYEKYAEAIESLEQALELNPSMCRPHYYLAVAHLGLGTAEDIQTARSEARAYEGCAAANMMMDVQDILTRIEDAVPVMATEESVHDDTVDPEGQQGEQEVEASMAEALSPPSSTGAEANYELRKNAGTAMLVSGLATCVGGIVGNVAVANYGYQNQEDDQLYEAARKGSNGLLVAGIAGGGVAVTGLMLLIIPEQKFSKVGVSPGPVTTVTVRF